MDLVLYSYCYLFSIVADSHLAIRAIAAIYIPCLSSSQALQSPGGLCLWWHHISGRLFAWVAAVWGLWSEP